MDVHAADDVQVTVLRDAAPRADAGFTTGVVDGAIEHHVTDRGHIHRALIEADEFDADALVRLDAFGDRGFGGRGDREFLVVGGVGTQRPPVAVTP
ncbi:hypothetical protein FQZ97_1095330 [compost metagenome]